MEKYKIELDNEECEDCGSSEIVFIVEDEEYIRDEIVKHGKFSCYACGSESVGTI